MTTRQELKPYNNQRLRIEGVLIDIKRPNRKNKYQAGLVFGSVKLPHQNIELDHIVISVTSGFVNRNDLQLFNKYTFTAEVGKYFKRERVLNIYANVTAYHLQHINENKFDAIEVNTPDTFSLYLQNRLLNLETRLTNIDIPKLKEHLLTLNEGAREQYVSNISMTMEKNNITHTDIMNELY